jgi:hypothetical protein
MYARVYTRTYHVSVCVSLGIMYLCLYVCTYIDYGFHSPHFLFCVVNQHSIPVDFLIRDLQLALEGLPLVNFLGNQIATLLQLYCLRYLTTSTTATTAININNNQADELNCL